jgi:hypothetical protein
MKHGLDSRLNRALAMALFVGLLILADRLTLGWLTPEFAALIATGALSLVGGRGLVLRREDERQAAALHPPLTALELSLLQDLRQRARKAPGTVHGSERAHPRCETNVDGHRCNRPENHSGKCSKPPVWPGPASGAVLLCVLLTGCPSPTVQTCPGTVVGEASRDVPTGVPLYSLRCGSALLWRGVCGSPERRGDYLYCDGKPAFRLNGTIEVIP